MRACPFCAEQVQVAAIVCKHCQRDIGPTIATADRPRPSASYTARAATSSNVAASPNAVGQAAAERRTGYRVLLVVALVLGAVLYRVGMAAHDAGLGRLVRPARVTTFQDYADLPIGAGSVWHWEWTTEPDQPICWLTGNIEVLRGGNNDVKVAVMSLDDYKNYINGHATSPYFSTGKVTAVTLNVATRSPGPKVLMIANDFSLFTGKHIQTHDLRVTCR
jgi:hypothetical protein